MKTPLLFTGIFIALLTPFLQAQVNVKLVKDINPGFGDSRPFSLAIANNKLFFIAYDGTDYKLFVSDGTEAATKLLGPPSGQGYSFNSITAYKNKVFFSYNDLVHGSELWVSDGTVAGTKLFMDIYPGATGSSPVSLTVANNKLFFIADNTGGSSQLYVSDGTVAGTQVIKDGYSSNFNGAPTFVMLNNSILFGNNNGSTDNRLWITDGTPAGTVKLSDVRPVNAAGNSVTLNNKVYFSADDNVHGLELWASDGTPGGTYLVKNISPNDGGGTFSNSTPQGFCVYNNKVYFSATDGEHGQELWVTDGTEANTKMVKDVVPGATGSLPYHCIVYNNKLYFITWGGDQLWVSDGTAAGTTEVAPLLPSMQFAAIWNNTMYFWSGGQPQVYQSDGTTAGTKPAKADNTASIINYSGLDNHFTEYKGDLYFSGSIYQVTQGYELVKFTVGTLPLKLLSFKGDVQKDDDVLTWQTATETNTAWFTIEQAVNGTAFTKAGTVAAAGNSSTTQTYNYKQASLLNPAGYYRLAMVDKDGTTSYSNIVKLARGTTTGRLTAFYNNGSRQIIINSSAAGTYNWQLYSAGGSLVKKGTSAGSNIIIPAAGLAGGVYILQCQDKSGVSKFSLPVF